MIWIPPTSRIPMTMRAHEPKLVEDVNPEVRSAIMRRVRGKNTRPELVVRKALHKLGFRYKLHESSLPGKPDLVLPRYRAVVFVHGCFWHGHKCRRGARLPLANRNYWEQKLARNQSRDLRNRTCLEELGWQVLIVWECQLIGNDIPADLPVRIRRSMPLGNAPKIS